MLSAGDVVDVHVASERNDGYLATRRGDHVQVLAWEGECPYGYRVCRGQHGPCGWLDAGTLKQLESSEQFEVRVSADRLDGYLAMRKGDKVEILHVEAEWVYAKRLDDAVEGWVATNTLISVTGTTVSDTALQAVAGDQPALAEQKREVTLRVQESEEAKPIVESKEPLEHIAARNEANADKSQEATPCTVNVAQALYPDHAGNLTTNENSIKSICKVAGIPEIKKGGIWRTFPKACDPQCLPVAFEYTEPGPHGRQIAQVPYNHVLTAASDVRFVWIQGDPGVAIKVHRPGEVVWINVFRYITKLCKTVMFLRYVEHQVLSDEAVQIKQELSQGVTPLQIPEPEIEMLTTDSLVQGTYFWYADTNKLVYADGSPALQAEADLIANYKPTLPLKPGWVPIWNDDMSRRYFVNQALYTSTWTPPYAAIPEYTPNQLQEMVPRTAAAAEVADDQPADKQSKILIVTCGVNNMERCGCTIQKGEWCWRNYIREKKAGDSNTVKFYVADDLIEFNSNLRYRFKLLRPRNILYVDCRIFKDRGDADVGLHHTGRLPECLDRIVSSERFRNFYKQLWASIRKMRGRYPDGDIAIVLACRSGRQRSESIRYILEKHLEKDGVDFQSVAMSSHGQWDRLCTKRQGAWQKCDLCSHKDVEDEKRVADLVANANRIRSDKRFNDYFRSVFRLVQTRSGLKPMSGWIDPP